MKIDPNRRYRYFLLGLLMLILAFNFVDRTAFGIVVENIKRDLGFPIIEAASVRLGSGPFHVDTAAFSRHADVPNPDADENRREAAGRRCGGGVLDSMSRARASRLGTWRERRGRQGLGLRGTQREF